MTSRTPRPSLGGRPTEYGIKRTKAVSVRMDDKMAAALEAAAADAGLPLARYCLLVLAEQHGITLQRADVHQQQLPLGA